MSDRPALEVAKKLNEKIEGFVGYSRSHHDIGLELMRAAQSACTAIEQLSDTVESLQREKEELKAAVKQTVTRASCVQCADMEQQIKELRIKLHNQAAKAEEQAFMWRERLEKAEAAAITPEMRETAEKWLKDYAPGHTVDYIAMALSGRVIIHDLLGKQG